MLVQNHPSRNESFRLGSCLIASIKSPTHTCTVHTDTQACVENRNLILSILKMGQGSELQALKMITRTCSIIENWECVEKQNLSFTLKGLFQLLKQSSASAQNNGVQTAAITATQLMASRITSWRVDLASPQPEPEDLFRWSGACQSSLSLESHSRFVHDDVNWKRIKLHILLTTGAHSASCCPAWLAAPQSLLSSRAGTWQWEQPCRETGSQLGSLLKDALTQMPAIFKESINLQP